MLSPKESMRVAHNPTRTTHRSQSKDHSVTRNNPKTVRLLVCRSGLSVVAVTQRPLQIRGRARACRTRNVLSQSGMQRCWRVGAGIARLRKQKVAKKTCTQGEETCVTVGVPLNIRKLPTYTHLKASIEENRWLIPRNNPMAKICNE